MFKTTANFTGNFRFKNIIIFMFFSLTLSLHFRIIAASSGILVKAPASCADLGPQTSSSLGP